MASKVMMKIPGQVQFPAMVKSPVSVIAESSGNVLTDVLRIAQLEQNMRFLQEQHAIMLAGLHTEIETLRQRNRDLQFQLVFSKGNQVTTPTDNTEALKEAVERAEISTRSVDEARAEARAADTRAAALQKQLDELTDRLHAVRVARVQGPAKTPTSPRESDTDPMSPAALKRRLVDAERLVRRLRGDSERQRREVHEGAGAGGGVTNFLFDPRPDHIQSMRNPLPSPYMHGVPHTLPPAAHARFPPLAPPARDFWQQQQQAQQTLAGLCREYQHRQQQQIGHATDMAQLHHYLTANHIPRGRGGYSNYRRPRKNEDPKPNYRYQASSNVSDCKTNTKSKQPNQESTLQAQTSSHRGKYSRPDRPS